MVVHVIEVTATAKFGCEERAFSFNRRLSDKKRCRRLVVSDSGGVLATLILGASNFAPHFRDAKDA